MTFFNNHSIKEKKKESIDDIFFPKSKLYIMMQWTMIDFKMQFYETDFFSNISEKRFNKCKTIYKFGNISTCSCIQFVRFWHTETLTQRG